MHPQIGLQLPSRLGAAQGTLTQHQLIELAVLADSTPGWDHLWVPDSVLALPCLARPVTADQIRELAAVGAPGRCAERLAELARAGATAVVLGLLSADPQRQMRAVTQELLPLLAAG